MKAKENKFAILSSFFSLSLSGHVSGLPELFHPLRRSRTKRGMTIKKEESIRIQAFHKPNSNAGISDMVYLFQVTTINYLTLWYE